MHIGESIRSYHQFKRGKCRQLRKCTQPVETDCDGRSENAPVIMSGNRLDDIDKAEYMSLVTGDMGEVTLCIQNMKTLTALLEKYYEKKVIGTH